MLINKDYLSISGESCCEFVINKSRFIGQAKHITSMEEAQLFIDEISTKHNDATHNCYAYVVDKLGNIARFSDDGEPQGTAGIPMLEVLKKRELKEVAVVVTRYFGGIKLGASGLISAYIKGVTGALDNAQLVKWRNSQVMNIELSYSTYSKIENVFHNTNIRIINISYGAGVIVEIAVATEFVATFKIDLAEYSLGEAIMVELGDKYLEFIL